MRTVGWVLVPEGPDRNCATVVWQGDQTNHLSDGFGKAPGSVVHSAFVRAKKFPGPLSIQADWADTGTLYAAGEVGKIKRVVVLVGEVVDELAVVKNTSTGIVYRRLHFAKRLTPGRRRPQAWTTPFPGAVYTV